MTAIFKENDAPPTPPAGYVAFYCKTDGLLYFKDDAGVELPIRPVGGGTGDLLSDGTVPLTANWDVGAWKIIAAQLESDIATGTAPFIVASETLVTNLNAEFLGGTDLAGIQALIDAAVVGLFDDKGNYDASTNTPDLDTAPSGIKKGDVYTTSVAGTFFTAAVEVGDVLRALQDDPTTLAHWAIVQTNLDAASVKTLYESNADTNAFTDAEQTKLAGIEAAADVTDATNVAAAGAVMDGDFSADEGMMRKSAAGTYTTIKSNLAAAVAPAVTDDSGDGYGIYSVWVDTTADKIYFCLDASVGAAVWQEVGAGTGAGGLTPVFADDNYTAAAGESVRFDTATAAAAKTVNLPATPNDGDEVEVADVADSAQDYPVTVDGNGSTIYGTDDDTVVLNVSGSKANFAYNDTDSRWEYQYFTPGASGFTGVETFFIRPRDCETGGAAGPTFGYSGGNYVVPTLAFDQTAYESAHFALPMPQRWDEGQFRFRITWQPTSTNTGTVVWGVYGNATTDGAVMPTTSIGANVNDAASGTTNAWQRTDWSSWFSMDDTPTLSEMIAARVQRNGGSGSDTYTADANFIALELQWRSEAPTDD